MNNEEEDDDNYSEQSESEYSEDSDTDEENDVDFENNDEIVNSEDEDGEVYDSDEYDSLDEEIDDPTDDDEEIEEETNQSTTTNSQNQRTNDNTNNNHVQQVEQDEEDEDVSEEEEEIEEGEVLYSILDTVPEDDPSYVAPSDLNTIVQEPSLNSNGDVAFGDDSDDEYEPCKLMKDLELKEFFRKNRQVVMDDYDNEDEEETENHGYGCTMANCIICNWDILRSQVKRINGIPCIIYNRVKAIPESLMSEFFNYIEYGFDMGSLPKCCVKAHVYYINYIYKPLNKKLKKELAYNKRRGYTSKVKTLYLPYLKPEHIYKCAISHNESFDKVLKKDFYVANNISDSILLNGVVKQHKTKINRLTGKKKQKLEISLSKEWRSYVRLKMDLRKSFLEEKRTLLLQQNNQTINNNYGASST